MRSTNKECLDNSAFVKTILMLCVIAYHSMVFWTGTWWDMEIGVPSKGVSYLANWLNSFHVYAFALVSGYLFAFKTMRGEYRDYGSFCASKAKRLIIPYCFVALIWLIPINIVLFKPNVETIVKSYLLCISPDQLWFLWMLFGVFIMVWPMRKVLLDKPMVGWAVSIILYGVGILGKRIIPNVFCVWTACQYVLFFYIGMRIRVKEEKQEKQVIESIPCYLWIMVDLVVFAGTIIAGRHSGTLWSMIVIGLNLILHIIGSIMAWTTLQAIANKVKWKNSKPFKTLSSYSMPMYLFHQQIIYFTIIWLNGKANPWIHAGVNFVAAIIGSFLISSILMRWKTTRFLIGEK